MSLTKKKIKSQWKNKLVSLRILKNISVVLKMKKIVSVEEMLLTRTLDTWVWVLLFPLTSWIALYKPLKVLGLGHLIYQVKGWNRKIMNHVFLISSPSFILILQRYLFSSREVNNVMSRGAWIWKNGARILHMKLVQWAPSTFFQSYCSMKTQ